MTTKWRWAFGPMIGVLVGGAIAQGRPTPVRVGDVEAATIRDRRLVTGELRAMRRARVAGREPGLVLEAPVREGQLVKRGTLLARLDAANLELESKRIAADRIVAEATLEERKADLSLREWQYDAFKKLAERGSSHEQEVRQAESAIAVARARKRQAEEAMKVLDAAKALIDQRIGDMRITAPFDAVVVARHAERGEWLGAGGAVVELVSVGAVEAWFRLPERLVGPLREKGVEVEVRIEAAARTVRTKRFRVVPLIDPQTRTFPLIVDVANDTRALAAGMSATAWVPSGSDVEHVTVPVDALLRNDAGSYVYLVAGPSADQLRAVPVPVTRLFAHGDRVAVRGDGLRAGARVVVEGNERLMPGAAVSIIGAPAAPPPASNDPGDASADGEAR